MYDSYAITIFPIMNSTHSQTMLKPFNYYFYNSILRNFNFLQQVFFFSSESVSKGFKHAFIY